MYRDNELEFKENVMLLARSVNEMSLVEFKSGSGVAILKVECKNKKFDVPVFHLENSPIPLIGDRTNNYGCDRSAVYAYLFNYCVERINNII